MGMRISGINPQICVKSYENVLRKAPFAKGSAKPKRSRKPVVEDHMGRKIDIYV